MFTRYRQPELEELLAQFPAVALLGPRQVGKTTLARDLGDAADAVYLDLEHLGDLAKLADPVDYLTRHEGRLVILDEIQRAPELFPVLRSLIDEGRRAGRKNGRFLLLGSASIELMRQSSESLAGRLATLELGGLTVTEVGRENTESLWLRGGFPDGYLAGSGSKTMRWREEFLKSYLERDIPQLGPRIPAETLRRFWSMLAHQQGGLLNAAQLARNLSVSGKTLASYLDLFVDLFLVRRLEPWHANVSKRLVKAPKVYLRDSGLLHQLLGITDIEGLLSHPQLGASWEGFVIENVIAHLPHGASAGFYRTNAGAEIDLILKLPGHSAPWAVEIKRSSTPKLERGFHHAREDILPERSFVICNTTEPFSMGNGVEAVSLAGMLGILAAC